KTSARGRQAKEYTPYPLWLVLPDQVSESTCKRRQWDPEAMRRPGGGVPGVHSRRHRSKNTVYFTYPLALVRLCHPLVILPPPCHNRPSRGPRPRNPLWLQPPPP